MNFPKRKNIRLKDFDYSSQGSYFITFCLQNKKKLLSKIHVGAIHESPEVELTEYGKAVETVIDTIEKRFGVKVDTYVIMPNHAHILITINENLNRAIHESPLRDGRSVISKIVGYVKMNSSKAIHLFDPDLKLWQRSYYDHIIRNDADYLEKADYILTNPAKWQEDEYFIQ